MLIDRKKIFQKKRLSIKKKYINFAGKLQFSFNAPLAELQKSEN
jgi:hypothetical protein